MARHRIKVPAAGGLAAQMMIVHWHVEPGGEVVEGDDLVSVEVEKVDVVIPSPVRGTLVEVIADLGHEVSPGDPLCVIESGEQL